MLSARPIGSRQKHSLCEMDFHRESIQDPSKHSGEIFSDILFIRMSQWRPCEKTTALIGFNSCARRIFHRYFLLSEPDVTLDFWYRGFPVSLEAATAFRETLKICRSLDRKSLLPIVEVLGIAGEGIAGEGIAGEDLGNDLSLNYSVSKSVSDSVSDNQENFCAINDPRKLAVAITGAEVGPINGRTVLALWWLWQDYKQTREYLSIFTDADDCGTIHEIHFSCEQTSMPEYSNVIADTLKSFQWRNVSPPPCQSIPANKFGKVPA